MCCNCLSVLIFFHKYIISVFFFLFVFVFWHRVFSIVISRHRLDYHLVRRVLSEESSLEAKVVLALG